MADDDPVWGHAFLAQKRDLLQCQLAEMRRVGDDSDPGSPLSAGGGTEDALLCGSNPVPLSADLADNTGANVGSINAGRELLDNEGGQ